MSRLLLTANARRSPGRRVCGDGVCDGWTLVTRRDEVTSSVAVMRNFTDLCGKNNFYSVTVIVRLARIK
jgi:hypothetical protein